MKTWLLKNAIKLAVLLTLVLSLGGGTKLTLKWFANKKAAAVATAVGLERGKAASHMSDLRALLAKKDGEVSDALDKIEKMRAKAVAVTRSSAQIKETTKEAGHMTNIVVQRLCKDWTDEHGRFHFRQAERELDIDLRFVASTIFVQLPGNRVRAKTEIVQRSPLTGEVLGSVPIESETAYWSPPVDRPKWAFSVGASWDASGKPVPFASVSRRLFWNAYAGAYFYNATPSLWAGYSWAF